MRIEPKQSRLHRESLHFLGWPWSSKQSRSQGSARETFAALAYLSPTDPRQKRGPRRGGGDCRNGTAADVVVTGRVRSERRRALTVAGSPLPSNRAEQLARELFMRLRSLSRPRCFAAGAGWCLSGCSTHSPQPLSFERGSEIDPRPQLCASVL